MAIFMQVLDEIEERSRRSDNAPPPPAIVFVEPPEPAPAQPRAAVDLVATAYRKMLSPRSSSHDGPSIDDDRTGLPRVEVGDGETQERDRSDIDIDVES